MSAVQMGSRSGAHSSTDVRAGSIALTLLRVTLMGCAAALVAVVGNAIWRAFAG